MNAALGEWLNPTDIYPSCVAQRINAYVLKVYCGKPENDEENNTIRNINVFGINKLDINC